MKFVLLPEIQRLIPPLSQEERQGLKDSISANGIEHGVIVWQQETGPIVLLDGHNRRDIAKELGIPCIVAKVKSSKEIPDLEAAQLWVMANQLGRRNLTDASRVHLAAKYYQQEAASRRMHNAAEREERKRNRAVANSPLLPNELATAGEANSEKEPRQYLRAEVAQKFGVTEHAIRQEVAVIKAAEEREEMATAVAPSLTAEQLRNQRYNEIAFGATPSSSSLDGDWQKQHEIESYKILLAEAVKIREDLNQKALKPTIKSALKKKLTDTKIKLEERWKKLQSLGVSAAELPIPSSLDDKPGTENDAKPAKNGTDWLLGLIRSLEATKATYTKKLDSIDPTQCVHLVDKERQDLRIAVSHLMKTLEKINEL